MPVRPRLTTNLPGRRLSREKLMSKKPTADELSGPESPHFCTAADREEDVAAWTEIDNGRFLPRRVRGSNHGRALG